MQREFHFQLSGVVRGYLGERFGFDALECTSGELVREVERRALPGVEFGALQRFVDQCDVARYARAEVPVPACAAVLAWARSLLVATPPPEPSRLRSRRRLRPELRAGRSPGTAGVSAYYWKSPEAFWLLTLVPLVGAWSWWIASRRGAVLRFPVARVLAARAGGLRTLGAAGAAAAADGGAGAGGGRPGPPADAWAPGCAISRWRASTS